MAKRGENVAWVPTAKQEQLLKVLLDPYHRMATVQKRYELAQINEKTYYKYMHDPQFMDFYQEACRKEIGSRMGELINIGIREARNGGQAGASYWKELMKIAGLIEDEKNKLLVEGAEAKEIRITFASPDERDGAE